MRLAHVSIEHFRGVRRFSTKLDATTVLIGENNCGKTSILDVVQRCLSAEIVGPQARFDPLDFHLPVHLPVHLPGHLPGRDTERSGTGSGSVRRENGADVAPEPIRVRLAFTEQHPGAWPDSIRSTFREVSHPREDGCLTVILAVEAGSPAAGAIDVSFRDRRDAALSCDVAALHGALRQLKPVLRLNSRELFGPPCPEGALPVTASIGADPPAGEPIASDLVDRLADLNAILIDPRLDDSDIHARLVELGRALAESHDLPAASGSPDRLLEALSRRLAEATDLTRRGRQLRLGVSMHGLVMVLLVASVVAARHAAADDPLSEPLLIIDDPEAHLHPTTLAFLGRVLRSVRAQKLVVTHSGEVLTAVDLHSIRRLHRVGGDIHNARLRERNLSAEDSRKIAYHIRARRGVVLFARCWLLIEGESEFWLMPAIAERLGYDLALESVALVEFAQCGVEPLIRVARDLGIEWHLLTDGDVAGRTYDASASELLERQPRNRRITALDAPDIEFCLWRGGFHDVYRRAAAGRDSISRRSRRDDRPQHIIRRAIDATSKPHLARKIVEALEAENAPDIPRQLRHAVEMAVGLARGE